MKEELRRRRSDKEEKDEDDEEESRRTLERVEETLSFNFADWVTMICNSPSYTLLINSNLNYALCII